MASWFMQAWFYQLPFLFSLQFPIFRCSIFDYSYDTKNTNRIFIYYSNFICCNVIYAACCFTVG